MRALLSWIARRLRCTLFGHRMRPARIYYPPAKSIVSGYRCDRCGHEQMVLWRWQKPVRDDSDDDEDDDGVG